MQDSYHRQYHALLVKRNPVELHRHLLRLLFVDLRDATEFAWHVARNSKCRYKTLPHIGYDINPTEPCLHVLISVLFIMGKT